MPSPNPTSPKIKLSHVHPYSSFGNILNNNYTNIAEYFIRQNLWSICYYGRSVFLNRCAVNFFRCAAKFENVLKQYIFGMFYNLSVPLNFLTFKVCRHFKKVEKHCGRWTSQTKAHAGHNKDQNMC